MTYPDPRYDGSTGEISASFRPANTEPQLVLGSDSAAHYLATGESTHGQFGLYRWDMGAGSGGPATHFHRTISESFFVLSGTVQLYNGERWTTAGRGDFLYVPEGGLHAFRNESGEAASMLILFAPARHARATSRVSSTWPSRDGRWDRRSGASSAKAMTPTSSAMRCRKQFVKALSPEAIDRA